MKKLLALSLILGSLTLGANAQSKKDSKVLKSETVEVQSPSSRDNAKFKGKKKGDKMKNEMGLTSDQQKQMKESREYFKAKKEAIKNNTSLSETAKKDQLEALRAERKAKMATILTPEQQKKMKEKKQNHKNHDSRK
ncbi:MAG: hypothetical protein ABIP68_08475 [Ferruginibacter sp.]